MERGEKRRKICAVPSKDFEIWGSVCSKSLPRLLPFCSPSAWHAQVIFAYLWETSVTAIKLTGSQFCRLWIMESYKCESHRTFSFSLYKYRHIFKASSTFSDVCQRVCVNNSNWFIMMYGEDSENRKNVNLSMGLVLIWQITSRPRCCWIIESNL